MNHLDLFSGIGGFALAAQWVWSDKHKVHKYVEIDKFCQRVIETNIKRGNLPNAPIHDDIRTYKHDGTAIDLVTGGWPCQPFSVAASNKRKFRKDERYLWPTMLETIRQVRPTWVIGENVTGIIGMELTSVLDDLESEGFQCQTFLIPACAVGANHRRNRVWVVANSNRDRLEGRESLTKKGKVSLETRIGGWELDLLPKPSVFRVDDGIPTGIHRNQRTKSLGNAIVPQVVVPIMQAIKIIIEQSDKGK